jgi:hypothetical protein
LILALAVAAMPAWARAQQSFAPIPLAATQYKVSRLVPGQAAGQAVFPVDQAAMVTVQILANDGALNTSILGPAGQLIDPTTVGVFGGAFSTVTGGAPDSALLLSVPSAGVQYFYSFPSLGAGNYTVRFATMSAMEVAVITQVATDSKIGAALLVTEPTLVLGSPAVLTAAIFDGPAPVAGASVGVSILRGSGAAANLTNLTLRDDGGPGDDAVGDGLYSSEFTPNTTGNYLVSALITGTTGVGMAFTRHAATSFAVVPKNSALSGAFFDEGVDVDGDGKFDLVAILVNSVTTTEGKYRAFVHLSTANGQKLVRSGEADLVPGSPGVVVNFEADAFVQVRENGPYKIDLIELLFMGLTGASPSDSLADAGQTRSYLLVQFQRSPLAATGISSDQAVDDNGDGKFDRLLVSLQVDVLRGGSYSWGFKLSDQIAREIDFASGSGMFGAGLNQLVVAFEGAKIGAFGMDGPYQLRDLLVQGAGTSLVLTDVGRTQPYRFTQFAGAQSNQPPVANAGPDRTIEASARNTSIMLDGSASSDPDGDALSYQWRDGAGNVVATTATANVSLPLGPRTFVLRVDDQRGSTASDSVSITVRDTTPPAIASVLASPNVLWPPNHKMVSVSLATVASDSVDASPTCAIASVLSNEKQNGLGDGDTAPDWIVTGSLTLQLRAERAGNGSGRVYSIVSRCIDSSANASTRSVAVAVPHNR